MMKNRIFSHVQEQQSFFSNPNTKRSFKRKTSVGNKNIEKKRPISRHERHFSQKHQPNLRVSFAFQLIWCLSAVQQSVFIHHFQKFCSFLFILYDCVVCNSYDFFSLFILLMAMLMRSFLLLLFQIVSSIQSFFNTQMLNLIIFLTVLWVGKFSCLSNRWNVEHFKSN